MTQIEIHAPKRNERAGYKVDVSRGQRIGRVSSVQPAGGRAIPVAHRPSEFGEEPVGAQQDPHRRK